MRTYPSPSSRPTLQRLGGIRLAYQDLGARDAPVWLVLHGGPGSASHAGLLQPFDLSSQRVVMADQRGAGRSTPRGHTRSNDLSVLVSDIEALREHLGIERWAVLGGSWGATLAMAYASAHPSRVIRMILRGAFDARASTVRRLFSRFDQGQGREKPAARPRPFTHAQLFRWLRLFHFGTPTASQRSALQQWAATERRALLHGMGRSARHLPAGALRNRARAGVRAMRRNQRQACKPGRASQSTHQRYWLALQQAYRIQAHYLAHRCFVRTGAWAQMTQAVYHAQLTCHIVHGRCDQACPLPISQRLAHRLCAESAWTVAGHLGHEAATHQQLRAWIQTNTSA